MLSVEPEKTVIGMTQRLFPPTIGKQPRHLTLLTAKDGCGYPHSYVMHALILVGAL